MKGILKSNKRSIHVIKEKLCILYWVTEKISQGQDSYEWHQLLAMRINLKREIANNYTNECFQCQEDNGATWAS